MKSQICSHKQKCTDGLKPPPLLPRTRCPTAARCSGSAAVTTRPARGRPAAPPAARRSGPALAGSNGTATAHPTWIAAVAAAIVGSVSITRCAASRRHSGVELLRFFAVPVKDILSEGPRQGNSPRRCPGYESTSSSDDDNLWDVAYLQKSRT